MNLKNIKMENNNKPEFLFDKVNYKILLVGLAVIGLGFLLMSGGGRDTRTAQHRGSYPTEW
jgi:hypothetical protein